MFQIQKVEQTPELDIGYPKELSSESISIPIQLTANFWSLPDVHKYGSVLLKISSPLTGTLKSLLQFSGHLITLLSRSNFHPSCHGGQQRAGANVPQQACCIHTRLGYAVLYENRADHHRRCARHHCSFLKQ